MQVTDYEIRASFSQTFHSQKVAGYHHRDAVTNRHRRCPSLDVVHEPLERGYVAVHAHLRGGIRFVLNVRVQVSLEVPHLLQQNAEVAREVPPLVPGLVEDVYEYAPGRWTDARTGAFLIGWRRGWRLG